MHSYKNSNLKKQTIWYGFFHFSRKKKLKERNKRDEYVWKRTTYRFGNWNSRRYRFEQRKRRSEDEEDEGNKLKEIRTKLRLERVWKTEKKKAV